MHRAARKFKKLGEIMIFLYMLIWSLLKLTFFNLQIFALLECPCQLAFYETNTYLLKIMGKDERLTTFVAKLCT